MEEKATSWVMTKTGLDFHYIDRIDKSGSGDPTVRALIYRDNTESQSVLRFQLGLKSVLEIPIDRNDTVKKTDLVVLEHDKYDVYLNSTLLERNVPMKLGGVYTVVGYVSNSTTVGRVLTVTEPNSMHMLWLIPQYVVLTMGEVMFSVTGLEFAFTQAPVSMKSLLQAAWLLTVAFGNLIVVIIAEAHFFKRQVRAPMIYKHL